MGGRVVLTGMGLLTSVGVGPQAFIDAILAGCSGLSTVTAFDTSDCRSHLAGKLQGFDASSYINPAKLRRIDEVGRVAISASRLAIDDAGFNVGAEGTDEIGVILGSFTAGVHSTAEYCEGLMRRGPNDVIPLIFSNTVANAPASLCGLEFRFRGPNVSVNHKEASALSAVAYSTGLLRDGRVSALVTGGADDIAPIFFRIHDRFRVLSPKSGREEGARPFDARRNGFVLGEGGFGLVLETWDSALSRGARIYGELLGLGASSSPCDINEWPVEPSHLARAMVNALEDAGRSSDDVDLVLASANGTSELDRTEAAAIVEVFGTRQVPVASIKGALGEFGAVGAASLASAVLSLRRGLCPPTAGFEQSAPDCPVNVSSAARPASGPTALINSFASGGTNYSVLMQAFSAD